MKNNQDGYLHHPNLVSSISRKFTNALFKSNVSSVGPVIFISENFYCPAIIAALWADGKWCSLNATQKHKTNINIRYSFLIPQRVNSGVRA